MTIPIRCRLLLTLFTAGFCLTGHALDDVNVIHYTSTTGTPTTSEGLTYDNNIEAVTDFSSSAGNSYTVISSAPNALVQRNGTPPQSSVWYVIDSGGTNYAGVHQDSYGPLLKSNNLLEGSDNTFSNGTAATAGNIERLDFTWNTPFTNLNSLAFAVFDRGAANVHDAFTLAIVTGVDANGTPTSYGGFLKVAAGWGAATNPVANQSYNLFRYSNGDNLTANTSHTENNSQGIGGVVIKVSDVTLPAGSQVYGYSLMGNDVNPTTASDLLNVANTSVYPANTSDSTGGGIDLAAVNGLEIREVPEPAAWAWLGAGGMMIAGVRASKHWRSRRIS